MPWLTALGISAGVALLAALLRALTWGGAIAATVVGTSVLGFTGKSGGLALAAFFVGSSLVSRITTKRQNHTIGAKGERRDAVQVLANGGAALLGAAAELVEPGLGLAIVMASLAAAAADTWATAIGALSHRRPRDITTGKQVPKGTSGAISLIGTLGGLAGAGLVGLTGLLTGVPLRWIGLYLVLGTGGMFFDSLLGATVQGKFLCDSCGSPTERRLHHCGRKARLAWGWLWLDNDGVNLVSTAAIGAAAAGLWLLWSGSS